MCCFRDITRCYASDLLLRYPLVKYFLVKYLVKKYLVNKYCMVKYLVDTRPGNVKDVACIFSLNGTILHQESHCSPFLRLFLWSTVSIRCDHLLCENFEQNGQFSSRIAMCRWLWTMEKQYFWVLSNFFENSSYLLSLGCWRPISEN